MTQTRILQTAGGHTIEVHGAHLISPKLFDITAMLFTAGEHFGGYELAKIVFTDELIHVTTEKPEGRYASYNPKDKTLTVSLQKHFLAACKNVQGEDDVNAKYLSLRAGLWFDMLTSLLHEGFHCIQWDTAPEHCKAAQTDLSRLQEIEDDCDHHANLMLTDLFRDYNIEPPAIAEEPYFSTRFMEFFVQQIQNKDSEWAVRQEIMVDSNLVYYDDEDKDGITTMRDWLRLTKQGDPDMQDDRWEVKAKSIPAAHANPAVMVAGVDTTPKEVALRPDTQVLVVDEKPQTAIETVAAVANAAPSTNVATVDDLGFGMLMSESDILADVKDSLGALEDVIEPDESDSGEYVPPTTPTPLEEKVVVAETKAHYAEPTHELKCPKCNNTIVKGGKFCPHCGNQLIIEDKTQSEFTTLPQFVTGTTATPEQTVQSQFIGGAGGQAPAQTPAVSSGGRRFTQSLRTDLPNIGMDAGTMKGILAEVYKRMHEHIFDKCGFQVCGAGTANAVGFNPAMIGNILQPISIADIPRASEFIIAYDKYDHTTGKTQMRVPVQNGLIAGKVGKASQMPMYAIYINNNGTECKRILMAQNPFKATPNGYSSGSLKAQQGNKISWVWDAADGQQYRKWFYKIENGVAEWL